ncbi:hypothetical protein SAY87_030340 [Trapa incisa]|uniref:Uncharacterized protein n=1 Tax=Trapa incisa TaxID=236973 RepID=A0AAN7KSN7_9MYRT|nr:hypothetical protein SAY87_030340 [Trapa incisa]
MGNDKTDSDLQTACEEEYENPPEVLPEGFMERTNGFMSHSGWNSILEDLWLGSPTVAWPLYAEQQFNAFLMMGKQEVTDDVKMDFLGPLGHE